MCARGEERSGEASNKAETSGGCGEKQKNPRTGWEFEKTEKAEVKEGVFWRRDNKQDEEK